MSNPAETPLDIDHLASFVNKAGWMKKSKDWKCRLLYRLADAHLALLTEKALAGGEKKPGFAERVEKKRK